MAGASGPESGANAGGDSRRDRRERTCGGVEHSTSRAGCGVDGTGSDGRDSGGPGAGAESSSECGAGGGAQDQFAGYIGGGRSGLRDAQLCRTAVGEREPDAAGFGIPVGECEYDGAA